MKSGIRILVAIIVWVVAGLTYQASDHISIASKTAGESREATLQSYRIAQSLKSLAAGYELTLNEYYSTVLDSSSYQKKATAQKTAIDRELTTLATLQDGGVDAASKITGLYKEMDAYRLGLEGALSSTEKDWDRARDSLYKLNILSLQVISRTDALGQIASERAATLDKIWQDRQSQSLMLLRIAMILAALMGVVIMISAQFALAVPEPASLRSADFLSSGIEIFVFMARYIFRSSRVPRSARRIEGLPENTRHERY